MLHNNVVQQMLQLAYCTEAQHTELYIYSSISSCQSPTFGKSRGL